MSLGGVIASILHFQKRKAFPKAKHIYFREPHEVEQAYEFLALVKARLDTRNGYLRLAGLATFFIVYITTLIFQRQIQNSFSIESRFEI